MASFTERGRIDAVTITAVDTWDLDQLVTSATSVDKFRIKNLMITGIYQIDQTTEVNAQFGIAALCLMRFPDTVSTPDPDFVEGLGVAGVDRQIFKWRFLHTAGQNNPVLFSMRFRAINVNPGQTLFLGKRVLTESGASINHRINTTTRWWQDNG